ncbi:leucine-rich repeat extensin-like protein 5 [Girardinichthys multiradiatus]|uniref:leucine-rich repeat extensin-like protein 5 n=1 Tax=Girardinichthys multiradiatus TaxID=208333 RepID=UPI001FAE6C5F|nr:leucine-rich repeat extensin-like protein 5 [Girardinichthys multiradiatus]
MSLRVVTEGPVDVSVPAHVTEGPGYASAPAHITEGLGDASPPAHVTEGPGDASAPSLQAFQGRVPPGSKTGSKPPEFSKGFEDQPSPIKVREGFEDGPPLFPMPEGSMGQIDVLPKAPDSTPDYGVPDSTPDYRAPDSTPDSKLRGSSEVPLHGQPPDRGSSTLLGRPPDQPAGSRCCRRPPRSLPLCRSPGLRRRHRLIRPLSSESWTPPELYARTGRPPGHTSEICARTGRPPGRPPELCARTGQAQLPSRHSAGTSCTPSSHLTDCDFSPAPGRGPEPQEKGSEGSHHGAAKTGHPTNPKPQTGRRLSMPATHTPAWHTPATPRRLASSSTKAKSYPQLPCSAKTHLPEPGGHPRQWTGHRNQRPKFNKSGRSRESQNASPSNNRDPTPNPSRNPDQKASSSSRPPTLEPHKPLRADPQPSQSSY